MVARSQPNGVTRPFVAYSRFTDSMFYSRFALKDSGLIHPYTKRSCVCSPLKYTAGLVLQKERLENPVVLLQRLG